MLTATALLGPATAQEEAAYPNGDEKPRAAYTEGGGGSSYDASEECKSLRQDVERRVQEAQERKEQRIADYRAQQERELEEWKASGNRSEEEQRAFVERQEKEFQALAADLVAETERLIESIEREWQEKCSGHPEPPEGDYGSDVPEACRGKEQAIEEAMAGIEAKWSERHKAFQVDFDAARQEFLKRNPSDAEWKAFADEWHQKGRVLFKELKEDVRAAMEAQGLGECWTFLEGEMGDKMPMPAYGASSGSSYASYGTQAPSAHPVDAEVEAIWRECEAKMQVLMEEHSRSSQASSPREPNMAEARGDYETAHTWDEPEYDEGPPEELKERIYAIQAECEARARALYEGYEQDHGGKDSFGSFTMYWDPETGRILVKGKYLSLAGVPEAQMMTEIKVAGALYIDRLFANGFLAEFRPEETDEGTAIQVFDSDRKHILSVHDNPRGVINVASSAEIPSVTIDLADHLKVERNDEGLAFTSGDVRGAILLHGGSLELGDANVVKVAGRATFLVADALAAESEPVEEAKTDALLAKKIGAEVVITAEGDDFVADATPIGDLEVKVAKEAAHKFSARVESEEGTGKTVVLKVDSVILASTNVRIKVEAVAEDGALSPLEAREASSLADALDPHDDGDIVEYWVVKDKYGVQVLVSFPHFSEKKVTVESADVDGVAGLLPGFGAALGVAAIGAALVAAGIRRRP